MKHVVITGANRGIGLELAHQAEGWRVTGVCRETSPALKKVEAQVIDGMMSPAKRVSSG